METKVPQLLPLARSALQGDILAALYLSPERQYTLTELASIANASIRAVHAEANRLVSTGWAKEQRIGRNRMMSAATQELFARPLTELLLLTHGPLPLLTEALAPIDGIKHAFIYGSWAARHAGIAGPPPNDVDLLIVGTVVMDDVYKAVEKVERRLRREVSIQRVTAQRWLEPEGDSFLVHVQSRPLVEIHL